SDALLTDPSFAGLPITPTVHVPFSRSAPAVIRMTGTVPSPWIREAALELIRREAASLMGNTRIEDRLVVDPLIMRREASGHGAGPIPILSPPFVSTPSSLTPPRPP